MRPSKKRSGGRKKPLEAPGSSASLSSKKQKVSGVLLDQQAVPDAMDNQQGTATMMGNHQPMATTVSSNQFTGPGISGQQLARPSMSHQQSTMSGLINQQSVAMGMNNQQPMATGMRSLSAAAGTSNQEVFAGSRSRSRLFGFLLPELLPLLDENTRRQLFPLIRKAKNREINEEAFIGQLRTLVGDQKLTMAVSQLQQQESWSSQTVTSLQPVPTFPSAQQVMQLLFNVQMSTDSSNLTIDSIALQPHEIACQEESQNLQTTQMSASNLNASSQERDLPPFPVQGLNRQQQQHLPFPHLSKFSNSTYGSSGDSPHLKQQACDSQMRQLPAHQNMSGSQLGTTPQSMNMVNMPEAGRHNSLSNPKRMQGGIVPHLTDNSMLQSVQWHPSNIEEHRNGVPSYMPYVEQKLVAQSNDQQQRSELPTSQGLSSAPSPITAANNTKVLMRKPSVRKKKSLEALGSSPPPSRKKKKVTGALLDQSIDHLNDVTTGGGVNLMEEEEQLFSGTKEDIQVSEESQRVVQEEEARLILQKIPLQKKLAEITAKCGLKGIGSDVEKCLSFCVEERMRGLISNLIRLSKQRADIEKPRNRTIITSDVRQQIKEIYRKVHEEWKAKQAVAEKLQKVNQPAGNTADDAERAKGDTCSRPAKENKEKDVKYLTAAANVAAANVAARSALGGDDILSKWQLMAEHKRQNLEGGLEASSTGRSSRDHQEAGSVSKTGRNEVTAQQDRVARTISVKDVIAVLERDAQMSRSTLLYRLYEKL